jgi:spore coat polysaccharide biosynthesis protein SpsF
LKIWVLIQARMGSKRLPGKSMKMLSGSPMITHVINRALDIENTQGVLLVTSANDVDTVLANTAHVPVFRGSEWDVLGRMADAARTVNADAIVRITGDCPLLASDISSLVVHEYINRLANGSVYVSNVGRQSKWPDGFDTEVFSSFVLYEADERCTTRHDREHVTTWIRANYKNPSDDVKSETDYGYLKLSVDTEKDFERVRQIYGNLEPEDYSARNVLEGVRKLGLMTPTHHNYS